LTGPAGPLNRRRSGQRPPHRLPG